VLSKTSVTFEKYKMTKYFILPILCILACTQNQESENTNQEATGSKASIIILGTIQDAGSPQIGCQKECCVDLYDHPDTDRMVSSIGLVDAENENTYLFDATPDKVAQMAILTSHEKQSDKQLADGIFLTHAHIGHYTGLMYLGKESKDADSVPLYVMPQMKEFLSSNGPWDQLITRKNVSLKELKHELPVRLSANITVTPFLVPHRDEYSETVGYRIDGPDKSALYIPDIDKWDKWERDIIEEIKQVDYAFIDATFYSGAEMNNRDISQIPHPFIIESLAKFQDISATDKSKIIFIHFNHTNPVIDPTSPESKTVTDQGFRIARVGDVFEM
jgi:pyrroloquinoline quinone biosynthesis protein B